MRHGAWAGWVQGWAGWGPRNGPLWGWSARGRVYAGLWVPTCLLPALPPARRPRGAVEVFQLGKALFSTCKFTGNNAGQGGAVAIYSGGCPRQAGRQARVQGAVTQRGAVQRAARAPRRDVLPRFAARAVPAVACLTSGPVAVPPLTPRACHALRCTVYCTVYCAVPRAGGSANFTDCDFVENSAQNVGGAISVGGGVGEARRCAFIGNSAGERRRLAGHGVLLAGCRWPGWLAAWCGWLPAPGSPDRVACAAGLAVFS